MTKLIHSELTRSIIGVAMEVHRRLGCGFLESVYDEAMGVEFQLQSIKFERQKVIDVYYRDRVIKQFICDFLVEGTVLVELKAIKNVGEIEKAQIINYLRATRLPVGLLVNFGARSLEHQRFANTKSA